jgi:hypothetical protein
VTTEILSRTWARQLGSFCHEKLYFFPALFF